MLDPAIPGLAYTNYTGGGSIIHGRYRLKVFNPITFNLDSIKKT